MTNDDQLQVNTEKNFGVASSSSKSMVAKYRRIIYFCQKAQRIIGSEASALSLQTISKFIQGGI